MCYPAALKEKAVCALWAATVQKVNAGSLWLVMPWLARDTASPQVKDTRVKFHSSLLDPIKSYKTMKQLLTAYHIQRKTQQTNRHRQTSRQNRTSSQNSSNHSHQFPTVCSRFTDYIFRLSTRNLINLCSVYLLHVFLFCKLVHWECHHSRDGCLLVLAYIFITRLLIISWQMSTHASTPPAPHNTAVLSDLHHWVSVMQICRAITVTGFTPCVTSRWSPGLSTNLPLL